MSSPERTKIAHRHLTASFNAGNPNGRILNTQEGGTYKAARARSFKTYPPPGQKWRQGVVRIESLPGNKVSQGFSAVRIVFSQNNRRENRRSLAILDRKEVMHLGALRQPHNLSGSGQKIAAAKAALRAIWVQLLSSLRCPPLAHAGANLLQVSEKARRRGQGTEKGTSRRAS